MKKVVIYTGDLCIHCDWAIELLKRKNIEFTEYNISENPEYAEDLLRMGFRVTPVTMIGSTPIIGFNPSKLEKALA